MRGLISVILTTILFFSLNVSLGQNSNKPMFMASGREPLGERDNSFAGSGGGKKKLFSSFKKRGGFDHKKTTQHFSIARKKNRDSFTKKRFTSKKLFGGGSSSGWGGKAFKKNRKEDKRLFKAPKNKARDRKRSILSRHR